MKVAKCLILLIFLPLILCDNWRNIPDNTPSDTRIDKVSVKGPHLVGLGANQILYQWVEGSGWRQLPNTFGLMVSASADGTIWHHNGVSIYRMKVGGSSHDPLSGVEKPICINAYYADLAIAVNADGLVYLWQGSWSQIGHDAKYAAIGEGGEKWMIGKNGTIYRWEAHTWAMKPGTAETIDVHNPHRVVITDKDYSLYTWQDTHWLMLDGMAKSASINETQIFTVQPSMVRSTAAKTCQDSFTVKKDMIFDSCSTPVKTYDELTLDRCCSKCRKAPKGGGCYHNGDECVICNGEVKSEKETKGATLFLA